MQESCLIEAPACSRQGVPAIRDDPRWPSPDVAIRQEPFPRRDPKRQTWNGAGCESHSQFGDGRDSVGGKDRAMDEDQFFEKRNFQTQRGGVLPAARLAYRTLGTLNSARTNAVLVPSWYSGTSHDTEMFMVGAGRALDPDKYFMILTDLLGSGTSSSPSNTPAPHERGRFPHVTIHDNVRLQHALITERLGLDRLRLVAGWSMGAAQTFEWACQFPDMVQAACPIAGSARTANYNKVFLLALRRALELDPDFRQGFYDRPPVAGLRAFATIYAGWGTSEPFFRQAAWQALGSR
ncbi:MAG TPA: alpha/beta fold hydrolase, partial [Acetobacteraceae bacterium]|nr:alpha/beta fold hydrolase [Acetobacteraceae bacterium]